MTFFSSVETIWSGQKQSLFISNNYLTSHEWEPKKMKARVTYEYAPGFSPILHYPKKFELQYKPFTCVPRTVKVKVNYGFSPGLHTTLECVNEIVLKHYIYEEQESP